MATTLDGRDGGESEAGGEVGEEKTLRRGEGAKVWVVSRVPIQSK